jgi:hypothetical protein
MNDWTPQTKTLSHANDVLLMGKACDNKLQICLRDRNRFQNSSTCRQQLTMDVSHSSTNNDLLYEEETWKSYKLLLRVFRHKLTCDVREKRKENYDVPSESSTVATRL